MRYFLSLLFILGFTQVVIAKKEVSSHLKNATDLISKKLETSVSISKEEFERVTKIKVDTIIWIKNDEKKNNKLYYSENGLFILHLDKTKPNSKDSIFYYKSDIYLRVTEAIIDVSTSSTNGNSSSNNEEPEIDNWTTLAIFSSGILLMLFLITIKSIFSKKKNPKMSNQNNQEIIKIAEKIAKTPPNDVVIDLKCVKSYLNDNNISIGSDVEINKIMNLANEIRNKPEYGDQPPKIPIVAIPSIEDAATIQSKESSPQAKPAAPVAVTQKQITKYLIPAGQGSLILESPSDRPSSNLHMFVLTYIEGEEKANVSLTLGSLNTTGEVRMYDFVQNRYDRLKGYLNEGGSVDNTNSVKEENSGEAKLQHDGQWVLTKPVKVRFS